MTRAAARRLLLLSLVAVIPAAAATEPPKPDSVLLVTIDTLRADRLGGGGAQASRSRMPRLEEIARRGVIFRHAFSQTPLTVPSHVTILTGLDPRHHGVRDNNGYALGPSTPTLATLLSTRGLRCAAFVGGAPLARRPDLTRGFALYDDRMTRAAGGGGGPLSERRAEEVVAAALSWFGGLAPKTRYFAWVHFYDPHDPYEAPASSARKAGESEYDAEVRYADAALGRLVESLAAAGRLERTLIVVAGDHGEMLGEHGEATHGIFLYQAAVAVPLVMVLPGRPGGRSVDRPTPLADLLPTILELVGAPAPAKIDGESAANAVVQGAAAAATPRAFYLETVHPRRRYGWSPLYGVVQWPTKFIEAPVPELYDLSADPGETRNLLPKANPSPWRAKLARWRNEAPPVTSEAVDEERLAALKSLGYVGSSTGASPKDALEDRPRRDPKRGIRILPMLEAGLSRLRAGDPGGAGKALEEALAIEPDSVLALHNRGIAAMMVQDAAQASAWFEKASRSDPFSDNVFCDLGVSLARQGRNREAEAAYRRALAIDPESATARFNLAVVMIDTGRKAEAKRELLRIREVNPDFPHLAEVLRGLD